MTTTITTDVLRYDGCSRLTADDRPRNPQAELDREAEELREAAEQARNMPGTSGRPIIAGLISRVCGVDPTTGELRYTPTDVLSWVTRAVEMGATAPRLGPREVEDVFRVVKVPNAKLREEYERRVSIGETGLAGRLARAIGAIRSTPNGEGVEDASYVLRLLGVKMSPASRGGRSVLRVFVSAETAATFARVLGLSYHSIGV